MYYLEISTYIDTRQNSSGSREEDGKQLEEISIWASEGRQQIIHENLSWKKKTVVRCFFPPQHFVGNTIICVTQNHQDHLVDHQHQGASA